MIETIHGYVVTGPTVVYETRHEAVGAAAIYKRQHPAYAEVGLFDVIPVTDDLAWHVAHIQEMKEELGMEPFP